MLIEYEFEGLSLGDCIRFVYSHPQTIAQVLTSDKPDLPYNVMSLANCLNNLLLISAVLVSL